MVGKRKPPQYLNIFSVMGAIFEIKLSTFFAIYITNP